MVRAGLQGDISGGSDDGVALCPCVAQRHDFGMGASDGLGASGPQQFTARAKDDATYGRIGEAGISRRAGKRQSLFDWGVVHVNLGSY